jgi:hypothetical protein
MQHSPIFIAYPWIIALSLIIALVYTFVLYQKRDHWSSTYHRILLSIRFVYVFLIAILLSGIASTLLQRHFIAPSLLIGYDFSASIKKGNDSNAVYQYYAQMHDIEAQLHSKGINTKAFDLNLNTVENPVPYKDQAYSPLSIFIKNALEQESHQNVKGLVLLSDGIYNQGINPTYLNINTPVYTVGLGDTSEKKDVKIKQVLYNKITLKGSEVPIQLEIQHQGFANQKATLTVFENQKAIATQALTLNKNKGIEKVSLKMNMNALGMKHYVFKITPLQAEFNTYNNEAHAYIEVIEDELQILICAPAPHPDIKAIKAALETKQQTKVSTYIASVNKLPETKFDFIIFHQFPTYSQHPSVEKLMQSSTPQLYIMGNQTNITKLNQLQNSINIKTINGQKDRVMASWNKEFKTFSVAEQLQERFNAYPPLVCPFGEYNLEKNAEIILYQKVGSVVTNKALALLAGNHEKAFITGEGLWQWRMQENATYGNPELFNKLINNITQVLCAKKDKRKFKVSPSDSRYQAFEEVYLNAELYNDVQEPLYGNVIKIKVYDEQKKSFQYELPYEEGRTSLALNGLKPGVYNYMASTTVNKKVLYSKGSFTVEADNIELNELQANHALLRQLAQQSDGQFYKAKKLNLLADHLLNQSFSSEISTEENTLEWIQLYWLLFLILTFMFIEYGMRKWHGII